MLLGVLLMMNYRKELQQLIPEVFSDALDYTTLANAGTACIQLSGDV
jgi:hypothetical protein